jgi:hypothetical protein
LAIGNESVHCAVIRDLAETVKRPLAEVATMYEELFARLSASATITTYLPVLVARKIRERYQYIAS